MTFSDAAFGPETTMDEDVEVDVEAAEESKAPDDSICPVCRGTTYVGETISCETCMYWFHFECVGVTHQDACVQDENEPYFCPKCTKAKTKKSPKVKSSKKTPKKAKEGPPIKLKISLGSPDKSAKISLLKPAKPQESSSKQKGQG